MSRVNSTFCYFPDLIFSAPPLRSQRLSGECLQANIHRRDAEVAETAQRKTETGHYSTVSPPRPEKRNELNEFRLLFPQAPGSHGSHVLHDRGFDRLNEFSTQRRSYAK